MEKKKKFNKHDSFLIIFWNVFWFRVDENELNANTIILMAKGKPKNYFGATNRRYIFNIFFLQKRFKRFRNISFKEMATIVTKIKKRLDRSRDHATEGKKNASSSHCI